MLERISTSTPQVAEATSPSETERIEEAARQFEALLVAAMLKSMREAGGGGWLGGGQDQTAAAAIAVAEEQFAQALTAQGGLGLARLVVAGLTRSR